jgi:integration host factor subunit beta
MNRSELVVRLSVEANISLKRSEELVDCIVETMTKNLSNGNRIEIRGFGSFDLSYRPARKARNPRSGETFEQEGKYFPAFKAGQVLRKSLMMH